MGALGVVTIASTDPSEWNGSTSRPSEARICGGHFRGEQTVIALFRLVNSLK